MPGSGADTLGFARVPKKGRTTSSNNSIGDAIMGCSPITGIAEEPESLLGTASTTTEALASGAS